MNPSLHPFTPLLVPIVVKGGNAWQDGDVLRAREHRRPRGRQSHLDQGQGARCRVIHRLHRVVSFIHRETKKQHRDSPYSHRCRSSYRPVSTSTGVEKAFRPVVEPLTCK